LSAKGDGIFFVILLMKSFNAVKLPSSDALTVPITSSEAGTTILVEGGTSTATPPRPMVAAP